MNREQVQQVQEKVRHAHHSLANILITLQWVNTTFDTLAPEKRAELEKHWQVVQQHAIEDLQAALALFETESTI